MAWKAIETVTPADAPFIAWIDDHERPEWATIAHDCQIDATGQVVDAEGDPLDGVTHWRPC